MALIKNKILDNGITLKYHRIAGVNTITNESTNIEVISYLSKDKRLEEEQALNSETSISLYTDTSFYTLPYDKTMNVDSAYEYLKTLDEFEDSTDDLD